MRHVLSLNAPYLSSRNRCGDKAELAARHDAWEHKCRGLGVVEVVDDLSRSLELNAKPSLLAIYDAEAANLHLVAVCDVLGLCDKFQPKRQASRRAVPLKGIQPRLKCMVLHVHRAFQATWVVHFSSRHLCSLAHEATPCPQHGQSDRGAHFSSAAAGTRHRTPDSFSPMCISAVTVQTRPLCSLL